MKFRILVALALQFELDKIDIRKINTSNQDPPPSPIKTMSVLTWFEGRPNFQARSFV